MNWNRSYTIAHLRGVPITTHVSLFFVLPLACLIAKDFTRGLLGFIAFVSLLFVHELGHTVVAWNRSRRVIRIGLYPLHGVCEYEASSSASSTIIIAWGGVLAQIAVLAACLLIAKTLQIAGFFLPPALAAALFVLIPLNLMLAVTNLLPIPPLDGATAWKILPLAWSKAVQRMRKNRTKPSQKPATDVTSIGRYRASERERLDEE